MGSLSDLPNISNVIEGKLYAAGVSTPEELKSLGSKEAFFRIRLTDSSACINMLYALQGAIDSIRWHNLSDETKQALKEFYKSL